MSNDDAPVSPKRRQSVPHTSSETYLPYETERVRQELAERGFCVIPQLLSPTAVERARKHLENETNKHLAKAVAEGKIADACEGLPLEERMAVAYATNPSEAPPSWVAQTKNSFVFQSLLFRDPALVQLVTALTNGRAAEVASRFNCRCKLPGAPGAAFPWHQDHAFFRMQYLLKKEKPKRLLAAWAPLVRVDGRNGGVELAPGSHHHGYLKHQRSGGFMTVAPGAVPGSSPGAPPRFVGVLPTLQPGDVMLFTDLTAHRSGMNMTRSARWSADWAYELQDGDDICPPLTVGGTSDLSSAAEQREADSMFREEPAVVPPPKAALPPSFAARETATTAAAAAAESTQGSPRSTSELREVQSKLRAQVEAAMASHNPAVSLHALAVTFREAGMSQSELYAIYDALRAEHEGDEDETIYNALLGMMDKLVHWGPAPRTQTPTTTPTKATWPSVLSDDLYRGPASALLMLLFGGLLGAAVGVRIIAPRLASRA